MPADSRPATGVLCPFDLTIEPIARFLNCELVDDPVYDGLELQWFDDQQHGTGLLAFLQRKADRRVDFYADPALDLDPATFEIGGGIGSWTVTTFDAARLEVAHDGVVADVAFTDRDGRPIEIRIDDRDGRPRRPGTLLAPVGDGIDAPVSLLLVHLHGFDLVRRGDRPPVIRLDGRQPSTGALPGRALHGRELIKYAAPLDAIMLNRARDGEVPMVDSAGADPRIRFEAGRIAALTAGEGHHRIRLELRPSFPDVAALADGQRVDGAWRILPTELPPLTGGTWTVARAGDRVTVEMEVTERWHPGPLPWLMRTVTTVVPVFKRWPTTYRWTATVMLDERPTMRSQWERTSSRDDSYVRATSPRSGVRSG